VEKRAGEVMGRKVVISFGRYNPPTIGHGKLFDTMAAVAQKQQADMRIYATHTQDKKKNPLAYDDKINFLRLSFPKYKKNIVVSEAKTIFAVLEELVKKGYSDMFLVVGDDRMDEFRKLVKIDLFNADHPHKINSFKVVSAGERDPDSEDAVEAMSSSKLRELAAKGDFKNFSAGVSKTLSKEDVKRLFNLVRSGLQINTKEERSMKEEKDPGFDPAGNQSRLWQTFRKWYMVDEEAPKELPKKKKASKKQKKGMKSKE
jgi:hypothetical protein